MTKICSCHKRICANQLIQLNNLCCSFWWVEREAKVNYSARTYPTMEKNFVDSPYKIDSSSYCFTSIFTVAMFCKYFLQRWQGHDSGVHFLMAVLKLSMDSLFFKSFWKLSYILGPKTCMLFKPLLILLTRGAKKSVSFRDL